MHLLAIIMTTLFKLLVFTAKGFFALVLSLVFIALLLAQLQYIQSQRFTFLPPKPFSGDSLYNPYAGIDTAWQKANFHAHARAWGGFTDGKHNSTQDLIKTYQNMDYRVIAVSDYHSINPQQDTASAAFVPVYEHGYNLFKAHRLAMGSKLVSFYDITFFPNLHDKQYIINRLKQTSPYLTIAHPKFGGGHTFADLAHLSGYECIEVLNHYRRSDVYWDSALTAGKPVWIVGNDDNHNIKKPDETGVKWTMIAANSNHAHTILKNLTTGKAYGVEGKNGTNDNLLKSLTVNQLTLQVQLLNPAAEIAFIGHNGKTKATFTQTDKAQYTFLPDDTYIRTVITTPTTKMYLNPVLRYDGKNPPKNTLTAHYNPIHTWFMRLRVLVTALALVWLYRRLMRLI